LVVVSIGVDVDELSAASGLPRANAEAVAALIDSTRRSHVALSSRGQFVTTSSGDAKASLVEAIESLVG
jgi:hypothetical protein